jgi:hypothetical protein
LDKGFPEDYKKYKIFQRTQLRGENNTRKKDYIDSNVRFVVSLPIIREIIYKKLVDIYYEANMCYI